MTPWGHICIDVEVGELLYLGDAILEVTEIGNGFITVKSQSDYTFQEKERIKLTRGGFEYQSYLRDDVNEAFKFLAQCGITSIDYVAVPVECASDIVRPMNRFAVSDSDVRLRIAGLEPRNYEGIIAKIGSQTSLRNFEEILAELDSDKDAIMIDRTNLAYEIKTK